MNSNSSNPHTAIPTWSGFIYQGKVAIYHVLQLLKVLGECPDYVLQLDSLEDFAILKNGVIESIHQVKALKSQDYTAYKEAFDKLISKGKSYNCNNAYFHIAKEITDINTTEIETLHPPIKIYKYGAIPWCPVDEIDQKIEEEIKNLFVSLWSIDPSKHSDDYVGKTRKYLDQIVIKQVLKIHAIVHANLTSANQAAYTQTIPFSEFLSVLKSDLNQTELGEDYYFYVLLDDFHRYYQDYCIENDNLLAENEKKKLSYCMLAIEKLDYQSMIQFIRNIMPHREFKFNSLSDYKNNTFSKEEIQEAFLVAIHKLKQTELALGLFFQWKTEEKSFSPTTINKGRSLAKNICNKIIMNALDTDLNVMFERSSLITTDIDVKSIIDEAHEVIGRLESDNRITKWKTVSLIPLSNAIGEINV
jgi:hypothetical protein